MLGDTIHAVASPPGSAARAVLRISGPDALRAAAAVFAPALAKARAQVEGEVLVLGGRLPALALVMPGPRSYTGEDVVELHVPGGALLTAELQRAMADAVGGALRPARPGEFTARACANGRLDALQAEGVLMLIHGADAAATAKGLVWLAGGLSAAVAGVRERLQDARALLEVGLDFEAAETGAVAPALWREPLAAAAAELARLAAMLPSAACGGEVLLLGAANAGKSTLVNALAGHDAVLVDAERGTTRDLVRVPIGGDAVVWDAPGDLADADPVDRAALALRDRLGAGASSALLVVDGSAPVRPPASALPVLAVAVTKADLEPDVPGLAAALAGIAAAVPRHRVAARTGAGIAELRAFLQAHSRAGTIDVGQELRLPLLRALAAVARAATATDVLPELLGEDLREALAALAEVDGTADRDAVLERIYARFCLGK